MECAVYLIKVCATDVGLEDVEGSARIPARKPSQEAVQSKNPLGRIQEKEDRVRGYGEGRQEGWRKRDRKAGVVNTFCAQRPPLVVV